MASIIPETGGAQSREPPPTTIQQPPPPPDGAGKLVEYDGGLGRLYFIIIVNLLLTILTLGLYRFWAKTRVRQFLWGHATVNQDRLEYAGTGNELLLGFLIVLFPILIPLFLFLGTSGLALQGFAPEWVWVMEASQPLLIFFLIGVAFYRARYYRLTRTRWRGIRAGQTGSAVRYGFMMVAAYLTAIFSAGLAWPWSQVWLYQYKMRHTWLGDRRFHFDGSSGVLYPSFLAAWAASFIVPFAVILIAGGIGVAFHGLDIFDEMEPLRQVAMVGDETDDPPWLAIIFLGVVLASIFGIMAVWQWYNAAKYRLFASRSRLDGLSFALRLDGWSLAKFAMANFALLLITLGLAIPWVLHRRATFFSRRLAARGSIDYGGVGQSPLRAPETGEGLADAFDVGGI